MFLTLCQQKVFCSPEFKVNCPVYTSGKSIITHFFWSLKLKLNKLSPYILKDDCYLKIKKISDDKVVGVYWWQEYKVVLSLWKAIWNLQEQEEQRATMYKSLYKRNDSIMMVAQETRVGKYGSCSIGIKLC